MKKKDINPVWYALAFLFILLLITMGVDFISHLFFPR